jgi:hypothetical protein
MLPPSSGLKFIYPGVCWIIQAGGHSDPLEGVKIWSPVWANKNGREANNSSTFKGSGNGCFPAALPPVGISDPCLVGCLYNLVPPPENQYSCRKLQNVTI